MGVVSIRRPSLKRDPGDGGFGSSPAHTSRGSRELLADDYFSAGAREAAEFMRRAAVLGYPRQFGDALDFGCGLGRVTRALADHFNQVLGVDLSAETVARARALNADHSNCRFLPFDQPDLEPLENNRFDLIYSVVELKQESDAALLLDLAREFLRILRPSGLLMLRVTDRLSFRAGSEGAVRTSRARRLWAGIARSFSRRLLRSRRSPIARCQKELIELIIAARAQVLQVDSRRRPARRSKGESRTFWVTK
jgi:SAM-dependent methyltransferase